MAITLEQARGIVRGVAPQQTGDGGLPTAPGGGGGGTTEPDAPSYSLPEGWNVDPNGRLIPPGTLPSPGDWINMGELFNVGGDWYQWNGRTITEASASEVKSWLNSGGVTGGGGGGGGFDTGPGYLDLSRQKFGADEEQRAIDNANWLKQFGLAQTESNRGELGQRAGAGLSTGNLALDLALRNDRLANDPGNFPAWLQAMQNNTAPGPSVQSLVGQGTTITPAPNDWLNSPQFQSLMESLFNYGTVPDAGAVGQVQQAYNTNPEAAQTFFQQKPEDLKRMFGTPLATGGQLTTQGPMTFKDLSTGKNIATAGEAGPEQITVQPLTQNPTMQTAQTNPTGQSWIDAWRAYHPGEADPVSGYGNQVSPSQGTAMALGKVLGAGGFSFFPPDVRQKLLRGELMAPGELPDWILNKLPPSIRQLMAALITSRLGGSGAEDFDWTRGLYEAKGFNGAGGIVR